MAIITGTSGDDSLRGTASADTISGLAGSDRIEGGAGADIVYGGADADGINDDAANGAGDMLFGEDGDDTISVSYNVQRPTATRLDGGGGDDRVALVASLADLRGLVVEGGAGQDTLDLSSVTTAILDGLSRFTGIEVLRTNSITFIGTEGANLFDFGRFQTQGNLTVLAGEGADTVQGTRAFGEAGDDSLTGIGFSNYLSGGSGQDTLVASATGSNTLVGGTGDDLYVVAGANDVIIEDAAGGRDSIRASVSYVLPEDVENLMLLGSGNLDATGNALANRLDGNAGANRLDGGAGRDTMAGGAGDDTYVVESRSDRVVERDGDGRDTVLSSVTFKLPVGTEVLVLTGTGLINGTGNTLDNTITGNAQRNILSGGLGSDTLTGAGGRDLFVWSYADEGGDVVTDFTPGEDRLKFSAAGFGGGLAPGMDLAAEARLVVGPGVAATAAFGQFLYDTATATLLWDVDGIGPAGARAIVSLTIGALGAGDIVMG